MSYLNDLPALPLDDEPFCEAAREMATKCNGFPYPGDRSEGQLDLIRLIRAEPELLERLLK